MRGYFDEEDGAPAPRGRDAELTLGTGALVAIPLGLLLLCGISFGLGYMMGHRGPAPAAATQHAAPTAAPDQEPLQASGSIPKPSAADQAVVPPPVQASDGSQAGASGGGAAQAQGASSAAPGSGPAASPAMTGSAPGQVRPALGNNVPAASQPGSTPAVRAALPPQTFMVQIAAVVNTEDAHVLTNALRARGYPVSERREPADGMIHVRIGPFNSREEATHWQNKLLGDGYNALVQP